METTILTSLAEYGVLGILVAILMVFIYFIIQQNAKHVDKLHDEHRKERCEWREVTDRQFSEVVEVAKQSNTVVGELKGIMTTIQASLKNSFPPS